VVGYTGSGPPFSHMDDKTDKIESGGVVESKGDTDIDQLLRARSEIDSALQRYKTEFTVLFADIVGSTAFFERFGDTAGLMMLQRHHELVLPAIEEEGGAVVKTIGDAVLAVFSAPENAVRSAVNIQQRLDAYNEDRPQAERIYTRVGLNFGSGFFKDKDVFGDVVNVAARFVKTCAPAQILVSRSVYEKVKKQEGITCRRLGSAAFPGKMAPEEIYEVLWTSEERYLRLRQQLDAAEADQTMRSALGRYELLDQLGRGAMGVVYKAYDPWVGRMVALKTVRLDVSGEEREELIRRLRQEAQAAGRLEHRNIVTVYDAGEAEGMFYLTMQFVKGKTLAEFIAEHTLLPVKQILLLFEQVCEGLQYAHSHGIVHRDLKPSNVIVTPDGVAKIVDFGVAKVAESGTTKAGTVLGTPSYMSPEQAQGGRVDQRSDIFSLGVIFYELLTGEKAFPGNTPTAIIHKIIHEDPIPLRVIDPSIDPALEKIVRKALAKDPFQRYQSCQELLADLKAAARPPVSARPTPAVPRRPRKVAAKRAVTVAPAGRVRRTVGLLAAILLWTGLGIWSWQQGWFSALPWLPERTHGPTPGEPALAQPLAGAPPAAEPAPSVKPEPSPKAKRATAKPKETAPAKVELVGERESRVVSAPEPQQPAAAEKQAPAEATVAKKKAPAGEETQAEQTPVKSSATLSPEKQAEVNRWFAQANEYVRQGRYAEAIFALEQVLRIDPNNERARQELEKVRRMQELRRREQPPSSQ